MPTYEYQCQACGSIEGKPSQNNRCRNARTAEANREGW